MSALIDPISEKLIILSLLNVHFLVSIMWQCEMLDVLCQQELDVAVEEKHDKMDDNE